MECFCRFLYPRCKSEWKIIHKIRSIYFIHVAFRPKQVHVCHQNFYPDRVRAVTIPKIRFAFVSIWWWKRENAEISERWWLDTSFNCRQNHTNKRSLLIAKVSIYNNNNLLYRWHLFCLILIQAFSLDDKEIICNWSKPTILNPNHRYRWPAVERNTVTPIDSSLVSQMALSSHLPLGGSFMPWWFGCTDLITCALLSIFPSLVPTHGFIKGIDSFPVLCWTHFCKFKDIGGIAQRRTRVHRTSDSRPLSRPRGDWRRPVPQPVGYCGKGPFTDRNQSYKSASVYSRGNFNTKGTAASPKKALTK